jgi:hypothetical protein
MLLRLFSLALILTSIAAYAQGPAAGADPAVLRRLLERHKPQPGVAFEFAAIGDQHYGPEGERKFPALQASINTSGVAFVVHAGDVKSGSTVCSDAMFADRVRAFDAFEMPMMLTPGDNEWTDCHRENNGSFNSLERLSALRRFFYPDNRSFGKRKMTLSQQSEDPRYAKYVENELWSMGDTLFATIHIVGSNNNLGRTPEDDAEYTERTAANFNWLRTVFSVARDNDFARIVLTMQANPGWGGSPALVRETGSGFRESLGVLEEEVIVFDRPVLVIMGDSHIYRIDQPLRSAVTGNTFEKLFRLETPGSEQVHWVRVRIDPERRAAFGFEYESIPANNLPHRRP